MKIKEKSGGEARGKAVQCVMGFLQRAPMSTLKSTKKSQNACCQQIYIFKKRVKRKTKHKEALELCTSATRGGNEATFSAENLQRLWKAFWPCIQA